VIGVKSVDLVVKDGKWALGDSKSRAAVASVR
jgi:branched-chain amino acid transport system substrate-binding protein